MIDIALVEVGAAYHIGPGELLLFQPLLQIFWKAAQLHLSLIRFKVAEDISGLLDLVGQFVRGFHDMAPPAL